MTASSTDQPSLDILESLGTAVASAFLCRLPEEAASPRSSGDGLSGLGIGGLWTVAASGDAEAAAAVDGDNGDGSAADDDAAEVPPKGLRCAIGMGDSEEEQ